MKSIRLTRGFEALVDEEDYEHLSNFSWYAMKKRETIYACRRPRASENREDTAIYMHREVMRPKNRKEQVDHINGIGTDNRKSNLRIVTQGQNLRHHVRFSKRNTSGFIGVSFHKSTQKWRANVTVDRRVNYLGLFDSAELAAEAVKNFRISIYED